MVITVLLGGLCFLLHSVVLATQDRMDTQSRQLGEQIYNHLKDRYSIKKYIFDQTEKELFYYFTLEDGRVLTYNAVGALVRRLDPDGLETHFAKGYPIRVVSSRGTVLVKTDYLWSSDGKIKRSLTIQPDYITASFYNDKGDVYYEVVQGPRGMAYRYDFSWINNRSVYNYYETRSWDGVTDYFSVSTDTGLLMEQWRATGGMQQVWEEPYAVFIQLLLDSFRKDYADRTQFKKDSFERTRGDVLLKNLIPEKIYPVSQFERDIKQRQIVFDDEWRFIDCTDVKVQLPVIELIEQEKVLVQKVKIKNNVVYAWVPDRKRWEPYPFDARKEELIPTNMHGGGRLEARFQKTEWKLIQNKVREEKLSLRLPIPPRYLVEQRLKLSQHLHDEPDFDDLYTAMQRASDQKSESTPIELGGEAIKEMSAEEIKTFQLELTCKVKAELQVSPQMNQRDSNQVTQSEMIVAALQPEYMLSREELLPQLSKLRRFRRSMFDQVNYQDLEVFLPTIQKSKLYTILRHVKREKGFIKIWKDDPDHPDKGYWTPYAIRPTRDVLYEEAGRLQIKVDEGGFKWELLPEWKSHRVTGSVFLAHAVPDKILLQQKQAIAMKPVRVQQKNSRSETRKTAWVKKLFKNLRSLELNFRYGSGIGIRFVFWIASEAHQGNSGKRVIRETTTSHGQRVSLHEILDWWGNVNGYQRITKMNGQTVILEEYGQDQRLLRLTKQTGEIFQIYYSDLSKIEVIRNFQGKIQKYVFENNQLHSIHLTNGVHWEYKKNGDQHTVRLLAKNKQWVYEKVYAPDGQQVEMRFAHGEKITYHYLEGQKIQLILQNNSGQQGEIITNKAGTIFKRAGNGKIVYFSIRQLDFILPDTFQPLNLQFFLNVNKK